MLKKFLVVVKIFTLSLMTMLGGNIASATESQCPSCEGDRQEVIENAIEVLEAEGTTTNMNVSPSEKAKLDQILSKKDKEFFNELKSLKQDGFKVEKKANTYIIFENLKDDSVEYESVGIVTEFLIKNNEEIAQKTAWINLNTNEVIRYDLVKIQDNGSEIPTVTTIANYDVKAEADAGDFTTYGFKFNGISFACSLSGLIACTAAFGGLTAFFPTVGAVLLIACTVAFDAGCATKIV